MHWQTTRFRIDLLRPKVMAIVNLTPDSFSDGGRWGDAGGAIAHCERMLAEGADILDLGAESTRPGAPPVPEDVELARLLPVLAAALQLGCPVSVDTNKAAVMAAVLDRGADIVNDVYALRGAGALESVAAYPDCGVCLMHMRGTPQSMQSQTAYEGDAVDEIVLFLAQRLQAAKDAGIAAERIALDPGIGFAKGVEQNLELLRRQHELLVLGRPLLVGWSRKSTLGELTGRSVGERMPASVAAALAAVQRGARILRVHDVSATVDALRVWHAAGLGTGADNDRPNSEGRP
jgi:dihydropteroate synthase